MISTPTAFIRENKEDFGLGCHFIAVEYYRRNAEALIHSLNNTTLRHRDITESLLKAQMESLQRLALIYNLNTTLPL